MSQENVEVVRRSLRGPWKRGDIEKHRAPVLRCRGHSDGRRRCEGKVWRGHGVDPRRAQTHPEVWETFADPGRGVRTSRRRSCLLVSPSGRGPAQRRRHVRARNLGVRLSRRQDRLLAGLYSREPPPTKPRACRKSTVTVRSPIGSGGCRPACYSCASSTACEGSPSLTTPAARLGIVCCCRACVAGRRSRPVRASADPTPASAPRAGRGTKPGSGDCTGRGTPEAPHSPQQRISDASGQFRREFPSRDPPSTVRVGAGRRGSPPAPWSCRGPISPGVKAASRRTRSVTSAAGSAGQLAGGEPVVAAFPLAASRTPFAVCRESPGRGGSVRRGHDPLIGLLRVGDHRAVSARDLDRVGAHPLCELPLGIRRNHLVVLGDQIPRGQ